MVTLHLHSRIIITRYWESPYLTVFFHNPRYKKIITWIALECSVNVDLLSFLGSTL